MPTFYDSVMMTTEAKLSSHLAQSHAIHADMVAAILSGRNLNKGNTRVRQRATPNGHITDVFLHGNHIAEIWQFDGMSVRVNHDTLAKWPTPTTKARLRALGVNLTQKKGVIYIDGERIAEA